MKLKRKGIQRVKICCSHSTSTYGFFLWNCISLFFFTTFRTIIFLATISVQMMTMMMVKMMTRLDMCCQNVCCGLNTVVCGSVKLQERFHLDLLYFPFFLRIVRHLRKRGKRTYHDPCDGYSPNGVFFGTFWVFHSPGSSENKFFYLERRKQLLCGTKLLCHYYIRLIKKR